MESTTLMAALGHVFSDRKLLETALTHSSFGLPNNERLEFLGDGVLNCVISVVLFKRYPDLPEGDLTRLRANLVRQESLHRLAVSLKLGACLRFGDSALKSGGSEQPSILADAVEALIGAVFIDAGYDAARSVIARLYVAMLDEFKPGETMKDAKTRLQEWLQSRKKPTPRYQLLDVAGFPPKEQRFEVACEIDNPPLRTTGQGRSRRLAEQAAADGALKVLNA